MKKNHLHLGKILGIPIGIDYSWFFIFFLLTWVLATTYYPGEYKSWNQVEYWLAGSLTAILLFGSVLLHELGHSFIAEKYKIKVKEINLFIFGGISEISRRSSKSFFGILDCCCRTNCKSVVSRYLLSYWKKACIFSY